MADTSTRRKRKKRRTASSNGEAEVEVKFRNYQPQSEGMKEMRLESDLPAAADLEKELAAEMTAATAAKAEKEVLNITTKKVNADLKRAIAKKMKILNRQTQEAIREINLERRRREEEEEEEDEEEEQEMEQDDEPPAGLD